MNRIGRVRLGPAAIVLFFPNPVHPVHPVNSSPKMNGTEEENFVEKAQVMWMARPHPGQLVASPACGTLSRRNGRGTRRGRIARRLAENSRAGLITQSRNQK
jgi:hypothetical protein